MEKKSYLEQMKDAITKAAEVVKGADDLETAYIAGRLDAKLEEMMAKSKQS